MAKWKIKALFQLPSGRYLPCGLNIWQKLWWCLMPGEVIKVRWPDGDVVIDESMPQWDWTVGPSRYIIESADPNDHYRPWLESHVGRQGWDWNWGMADRDVVDNCLTIKFRRGKEAFATMALLMWT